MTSPVGPIVGDLGGAAAGSGGTPDAGSGNDFAINDLVFKLAPTDQNPYQRATAQFRKEQFDSQANVGDQSLTGWWTRGQLSFHKGAGILYHEVQANENIIERFDSGNGVDPFTPGTVTPSFQFDEVSLTDVREVVHVADLLDGDRLVALTSTGDLYQIGVDSPFSSQTPAAITITGTADVTAITGSKFHVYFTSGLTVQVWSPGDATATTVWTKTDGLDFVGIWYAKERLWVVDGNGNWFVVATDGGTFADADKDFTIKDYGFLVSGTDTWALAESPSSVYIGVYNEIYSISVDVDAGTLLPTLGAPTMAADLPNNEQIGCLAYLLGYIAIATGKGVRFALIQDGGALAYGPLLSNVNFGFTRRMAARGQRISLPGYYFEEKGLWSFDTSSMVDTLQPAWVNEVSLYDGAIGLGATGAINTAQGVVCWSGDQSKVYRLSTSVYADGGALSTGYHRFGTLDPKFFSSVVVRTAGTGGSIDVYRRDPAQTVPFYTDTLIGTVDSGSDADIDLGPDEPTERVGLRFVFNRDPDDDTKAPQLLGYQLKAMPLPRRQRLVRVPLMLFDREVDGLTRTKRGRPGDAWTRLAALEALEESNAVVTYADSETGETGSGYIEAVEVKRTAPTSRQEDGFGGLLYLTIRKLA